MSDAPAVATGVPADRLGPSVGTAPETYTPEVPTPVAPPAPSQSARRIVEDILRRYGLEALVDVAMREIQDDSDINVDRLMSSLRDTDTYRTRFAGMVMREQQGLNAISEGEYVALENAYAEIMRAAGMPSGFYDSPDDFAALIGNNVSVAEVSQRITVAYRAANEADQTVRDELTRMYGVTQGELAAYMLDPDRALPILERQISTARIGAAAARQGFSVDQVALERMAALGVSEQDAVQTFGTLAQGRELLQSLDAGETAISVEDAALGLSGADDNAARRIRQRQRRRNAEFEGGGSFATQGSTVTGLSTT